MNEREALKLALEALEVATTPLAKDRQEVLRAQAAIREVLAQPEQEPVAWATREDFYRELDRTVNRMRQQMEIKGVVMRCADYDIALPVIDIREGHVLVGQVATPPQRKPLTDEQMFELAEIAWRHGWASCRDAEYVGEEAEDERWGMVGAEVVQDIAAHGIKGEA